MKVDLEWDGYQAYFSVYGNIRRLRQDGPTDTIAYDVSVMGIDRTWPFKCSTEIVEGHDPIACRVEVLPTDASKLYKLYVNGKCYRIPRG